MTLFFLILIASAIYVLFIYQNDVKNKNINNTSGKCPNCGSAVESHFNVCPICKETLKTPCPACGEKLSVKWEYCPFCECNLKKNIK